VLSLSKTRLRAAAAVCGAVVLTVGLTACGSSSSSDAGSGSAGSTAAVLNVGYVGAGPPSFDPHSGATGGFQAIFPAYDTLLHVDAEGTLQPWLATEWKFVDPTTLELKLRTGVKFSDGTAFDAAAVKANLEYARDIEQGTGYQPFLKAITDVQAVDATTVHVVIAAPNPGLPFDLSQLPGEMVSPKALAAPDQLVTAPAGTGPYVVDTAATKQGTTLAWKRNPDYWATDQKAFPYDTVVYTFGQDGTAIRNLAQAGSVDLLDLQPGDPVPAGFETVNSTSGQNAGFTGLWLDVTGTAEAALADVRVRQAMNYAIDRKTIAETVYEGAATPVAAVPVTDQSSAFSDALSSMYPFDQAKAKQLLADAGYSDGFSIKVLSLPIADSFSQAIAANLRDVGIDAQINSVNGPDLPKEVFSGTYPAGLLLSRPTGQPGQDLSALFSPNAFFNVHKADDPKLTEMLATAAALTDQAAQDKAYQEAAAYAAQQSWFAGTLMLQQISGFKSSVVKPTPPPFGEIFLYHYTTP
jgi:peptide/nickel transport system substrate-binding protein